MSGEIIRDANTIAEEINLIKEETGRAIMRGLIEIGKRLVEAKSLVPYGKWGQWLEDNVAYSERTAQDLMRIAKEYGSRETQALAEIQNKEQAVLLLALGADEREQFVKEHDLSTMSTRQLEEELAQIKEERDKAQLTIEELLGKLETQEEQPEKEQPDNDALEEERRKSADLEKSLTEARKQVREAEERRQQELAAEQAKARKADADREKTKKELAEWRKKAESQQKQLDRMGEELTEAREKVRTVEVLPESVGKELAALRAKASRSNAESEMRAAFDAFRDAYERLIGKLKEAEEGSEEEAKAAGSYRAAFYKATLTMAERMK